MAQGHDGGPDAAPLTATVAEQLREKAETERALYAERKDAERVHARMEAHKADEQAAVERHLVASAAGARATIAPALPATGEALRSAFSRARPTFVFAAVLATAVLGRGWVRRLVLAAGAVHVARAIVGRVRAATEAAGA